MSFCDEITDGARLVSQPVSASMTRRAPRCAVTFILGVTLTTACAVRTPKPPRVDEILRWRADRLWGPGTKGSVVDVVNESTWMPDAVGMPTALMVDGRWWLWFAGIRRVPADPYLARLAIGLAMSDDSVSFTIARSGMPVLMPGPAGTFDSHSVSHPCVLRDETGGRRVFRMYYAGADGMTGYDSVRVERIGLAESVDGIKWSRISAQPVVDIGGVGEFDSIQASSPFVLRRPDGFVMWYGAYDGHHRIAWATSPDGLQWTKRGPVHGLRGAESGELGAAVYFDGSKYFMLYNSVEGNEWRMYGATSVNGFEWTPAYSGQPLVGQAPAWSFAAAGPGRNSIVHPTRLLLSKDGALVYYMGEDEVHQRIGLLKLQRPVGRSPN